MPRLISISLALALAWIAVTATAGVNEAIVLVLEEPASGVSYSGVSNIRGYAVAPVPIERIKLSIDGQFTSDIPYGSSRADVGRAFPEFPNAEDSGFSMAWAYPLLSSGPHTFTVEAVDANGDHKTLTRHFRVARFGDGGWIGDPAQVSLSQASITPEGNTIHIRNMEVQGKAYDVVLEWRTATQGFALSRVRPAAAGTSGTGASNSGAKKEDSNGTDSAAEGNSGASATHKATAGQHSVRISWQENPEHAVNSPGGGYRVHYSTRPGFNLDTAHTINVPYRSGPRAPTAVTLELAPGTYYFRVTAYSALNPEGSAPSAPQSVTVP